MRDLYIKVALWLLGPVLPKLRETFISEVVSEMRAHGSKLHQADEINALFAGVPWSHPVSAQPEQAHARPQESGELEWTLFRQQAGEE
ncbi:Uncharacterised protein [Bordetella trematum]|uniref:Uncharacterized protein n=1 Tax=Bordetella trematum TaxID=123899 RepID=A0A157RKR0_9BORD|nr:Uncharacterised protein [Bordetella trematum]SAI73916.1 Uncharacterised protein [Bordetella trematum]SUV97142.1 Uncharacterised protein [Bordetella trematum]